MEDIDMETLHKQGHTHSRLSGWEEWGWGYRVLSLQIQRLYTWGETCEKPLSMLPWSATPHIKRRHLHITSPLSVGRSQISDWGCKVEGISDCIYLRSALALGNTQPSRIIIQQTVSANVDPRNQEKKKQTCCRPSVWGVSSVPAGTFSHMSYVLLHVTRWAKRVCLPRKKKSKSGDIDDLHGCCGEYDKGRGLTCFKQPQKELAALYQERPRQSGAEWDKKSFWLRWRHT